MLKTKRGANLAPTEKQIKYAKSLGIGGAELLSRKELALAIEQAIKAKKAKEKVKYVEEKTEKVETKAEEEAVVEEETETFVEEYPGYTGIQNAINICIPISRNRDTFILLKKKKMYENSPSLLDEFLLFLRRIGAKRNGDNIFITTDNNDGVFSPSYVRTVLDSFFIQYSWKYVN